MHITIYLRRGKCLAVVIGNVDSNQPITWSRVHLEKLINVQLVRKFPAFYGK